MVQYYVRHVPELSTLLGPFNKLCKKEVVFKWTTKQQSAFKTLKSKLPGGRVITHFDDKRELFIAADASENRVNAVLFHKAIPKVGSNVESKTAEQVISYASVVEQNYSPIEKQALAIIVGI